MDIKLSGERIFACLEQVCNFSRRVTEGYRAADFCKIGGRLLPLPLIALRAGRSLIARFFAQSFKTHKYAQLGLISLLLMLLQA